MSPGQRPQISVSARDLKSLVNEFVLDCQYRHLTQETIRNYENLLGHLFWFLEQEGFSECSPLELKKFFCYLQEHRPEGHWGKKHLTRPVSPCTARDYYTALSRLFNWAIQEDILTASPMKKVSPPVLRTNLKQPLRPEQVQAMLDAARRSSRPERNTAVLLFLLDTGVRAAELCRLQMKDMDFDLRQAKVLGKGRKIRTVYWGINSAKALAHYLRKEQRGVKNDGSAEEGEEPLFPAVGGTGVGGPLTPQGLYKLVREVGKEAGVKCGCHDWRRTFAVNILRNGANLISVQRLMGHETLSITAGYLNVADADIENQHREFSPADHVRMATRTGKTGKRPTKHPAGRSVERPQASPQRRS